MEKAMKSQWKVICKGNLLITTVWRLDQREKRVEAQDEVGRKLFQYSKYEMLAWRWWDGEKRTYLRDIYERGSTGLSEVLEMSG